MYKQLQVTVIVTLWKKSKIIVVIRVLTCRLAVWKRNCHQCVEIWQPAHLYIAAGLYTVSWQCEQHTALSVIPWKDALDVVARIWLSVSVLFAVTTCIGLHNKPAPL